MTYGRSPKKPTVGRLHDPLWVANATYRRSFLCPFVLGSFAECLEGGFSPGKGGLLGREFSPFEGSVK